MLFRSNNGIDWSAPEDITNSIYGLNSSWSSLFFASGRICQSRVVKVGSYYRLYAAVLVKSFGNAVLYSDDFGETWQVLGSATSSPASSGDEAKVEELSDGTIVLSSRKAGGRYYNRFTFDNLNSATGSWGGVQNYSFGGSASCNGEVLKVKARHTSGREVNLLLQTLPIGSNRENICLYYKVIEDGANMASGWSSTPYVITPNYAAYSTMCVQRDGRIGIYWEDNGTSSSTTDAYNMHYQAFDLNTLAPDYTLA